MKTNSKVIKLSDIHYIIVDDSEIKKDWKGYAYKHDVAGKIFKTFYTTNPWYNDAKVITHSTEPLEPSLRSDDNTLKDFVFIKPLSLSEVEEAINGYSVEKMADEVTKKQLIRILGGESKTEVLDDIQKRKYYYTKGFKAHQELVKDKLFTLDDMRKAFIAGDNYGKQVSTKGNIDEFIQSLLPKTEWDIEFDEQGKIKLI